jgi:hypothetical protein
VVFEEKSLRDFSASPVCRERKTFVEKSLRNFAAAAACGLPHFSFLMFFKIASQFYSIMKLRKGGGFYFHFSDLKIRTH